MLRKLIVFAITSGLAGRLWRAVVQKQKVRSATRARR